MTHRDSLCLYIAFVFVCVVGVPAAVRVPVEWVLTSDGDQTDVMTGLLYTIYNVQLNGTVTYLKSDNVTSNIGETQENILVVRNLNQRNGFEYLPGGRFEKTTFFAFQKHSGHYYKLIHIELRGPVTYKPANLMPTNRLGIMDDTLVVDDFDHHSGKTYYQKREINENSTLFMLLKYMDGYKLFHKELNAPVTYDPASNSPINMDGSMDNWLVVRSNRSTLGKNYLPGGPWEESTEFRFSRVRHQLMANILNFTYNNVELIQELAEDSPGVSESMLNLTNEKSDSVQMYSVNNTKQLLNTATIQFSNSKERRFLQDNVDVKISVSLKFIPGKVSDRKIANFSLKLKKVINTDVTEIRVLVTFEVLPRERVEIKAFWIPINVKIPFEASAIVTAVADQINDDGTVGAMLPVGADAVAALLRARGLGQQYMKTGDGIVLKLSGTVSIQRAVSPFATAVYHKIR